MSGRKTSCATESERLSTVAESGRAGSTSGRSTSDRSAGVSVTQQLLAGRRSTNPTRFSGRASCIKKVANVAASVDLMSDTRANRGSIAGRRRASVTQPGIGERRGSMSSIVFAAFAGKGAREKTRRNRPRPINRINSDLMAAVRNGDTDEVHGCLSTSANETSAHFAAVVRRYDSYVAAHPDHAFRTTLEGLTLRQNQTQVTRLFDFLGERLTPRLRKLARTRLVLRDWSEETHQRRIKRVADDGTVVVEKKGYAFSDDAKKLLELKRAAKALGTTPEEAAAAPQVVPPSARQQHKASAARKRGLVSAAEAAVVDLPAIDRDNGMLWMGR